MNLCSKFSFHTLGGKDSCVAKILYRSLILLLIFLPLFPENAAAQRRHKSPQLEFQSVSLQLKWFHSFQFAGYYAAVEKGFYAQEGLNVEIRERDINRIPVDQILSGNSDFAVADSSIILQRLNGRPVVALAAIFQSSPLVLISLAEKNIVNPLDLTGKRVMYQKDIDDAVIMAVFNEVGLSDSDFSYVPHTFDDEALIKDQADAMSAYLSDQPFLYRNKGYAVNILSPANYGVDFYGDILITSESMMKMSPNAVVAFRRASIRGWRYALDNVDEVYTWLESKYLARELSREKFLHEANAIRRMIKPRLVEIGTMSNGRFERIAQIYKERGLASPSATLDGLSYEYYVGKSDNGGWARITLLSSSAVFLLALVLGVANLRLNALVKKRTNESWEANQAKTAFLANMSHELRTPLNSIIGFSERLLKRKNADGFTDRQLSALTSINRNGHYLLSLINDVLDLSKIESGKMVIMIETCSVRQIIESCVMDLQQMAEEKDLEVNAPSVYPCELIDADPIRLKQIVLNLLSNAIKYTAEGKITIRIDSITMDSVDYCAISVTDTGVGIKLEDQRRLFQRFEQFDESSKMILGYGTGLGLAIVAEFTRLLGGHVECESEFGKGSCFTVYLPVEHES